MIRDVKASLSFRHRTWSIAFPLSQVDVVCAACRVSRRMWATFHYLRIDDTTIYCWLWQFYRWKFDNTLSKFIHSSIWNCEFRCHLCRLLSLFAIVRCDWIVCVSAVDSLRRSLQHISTPFLVWSSIANTVFDDEEEIECVEEWVDSAGRKRERKECSIDGVAVAMNEVNAGVIWRQRKTKAKEQFGVVFHLIYLMMQKWFACIKLPSANSNCHLNVLWSSEERRTARRRKKCNNHTHTHTRCYCFTWNYWTNKHICQ